jgi:prepilin-type N-terminal cleavage/methylation domain-containing protein
VNIQRATSGFTLMELMVAMVIVAILASGSVMAFTNPTATKLKVTIAITIKFILIVFLPFNFNKASANILFPIFKF